MKIVNYHATFHISITPQEAIKKINHVAAWWGQDFSGSARQLDDVFTIRFGETWVTFKVVDVMPAERLEWEIIDCHLPWLIDKAEWKNTNLIWELSAEHGLTRIGFIHVGLIPEMECYDTCSAGWDFYLKESLFKLLTENQGRPNERPCAGANTPVPPATGREATDALNIRSLN
ncbi:MAG TPA: SRPBCC domain-containing protein [Verrucomicrobiae bacterium]|nr:SRPBCC domain-containing protein [Verrucomicrobiae bacterium]